MIDDYLVGVVSVHVDNVHTVEHMQRHRGGYNGGDAKLHEGASVGGHDRAHGLKRVILKAALDTKQGNLSEQQEDEEATKSPDGLLAELDLSTRLFDFW